MDRWRAAGALLALAACFACSAAAPTASDHTSLDLYNGGSEADGCFYNFQRYGEGDRIMTNEPCLNCTCHNRMLMCYLRVCPFTKAIGQDCTVEKRADQCCPIVTCPDVPVDLLTSTSTSSPAEYGGTGVGRVDNYGCTINGKYFSEGAKVPPSPNKPCEHCYCIRNMTTCVMQECTLHVDGCTPIYHKDVCCPVRYFCDHPEDVTPLLDDMTTTVRPTPGFLLTTTTEAPVTETEIRRECTEDGQIYYDGALIKTEKPCVHCYCMKGDIVCVVQECGTPMENEGKNCTSIPPREGQCCPDTYICEGDGPTDFATGTPYEEFTTLQPPRRVSVEGSGYRNEPDEIPYTEVPTYFPEIEGSGEEEATVKPIDTSESLTPAKSTTTFAVDDKLVTTEGVSYSSVYITTQSPEFEKETEKATTEPDKGENTVPTDILEKDVSEPSILDKTTTKEESRVTESVITSDHEEVTSGYKDEESSKPSILKQTESIYDKDITDIPGEKLTTVSSEVIEKQSSEPSVLEQTTPKVEEKVPSSTFVSEHDMGYSTVSEVVSSEASTLETTTRQAEVITEKLGSSEPTILDQTTLGYEKTTIAEREETIHSIATESDSSETMRTSPKDEVETTEATVIRESTTTPSRRAEQEMSEASIAEQPTTRDEVKATEPSLTGDTVSSEEDSSRVTTQEETTSPVSSETTPIEIDESETSKPIMPETTQKSDEPKSTEPTIVTEDKQTTSDGIIATDIMFTQKPEDTAPIDIEKPTTIESDHKKETTDTSVFITPTPTIGGAPEQNESKVTIPSQEPTPEYIIPEVTKLDTELTTIGSELPVTTTINPQDNEIGEDITPIPPPGRIPGEGDCLLNGITYRNNSSVPNSNKCHSSCKCVSSIVKCDPIICSPQPEYMDNCQPIYDTPESCCPTYVCDHSRETIPPQPHSQMSGTESPLPSPSIECHGDECEVSKEKAPTESLETKPSEKPADSDSETCIGDNCVPLTEICNDDKCKVTPTEHESTISPIEGTESCVGESCDGSKTPDVAAPCEGESCLSVPISAPCEGDNCEIIPGIVLTPVCNNQEDCKESQVPETSPTCEGTTCTGASEDCVAGECIHSDLPQKTSQDDEICASESDCKKPDESKLPECVGETCRRKISPSLEHQQPSECTDSQCIQQKPSKEPTVTETLSTELPITLSEIDTSSESLTGQDLSVKTTESSIITDQDRDTKLPDSYTSLSDKTITEIPEHTSKTPYIAETSEPVPTDIAQIFTDAPEGSMTSKKEIDTEEILLMSTQKSEIATQSPEVFVTKAKSEEEITPAEEHVTETQSYLTESSESSISQTTTEIDTTGIKEQDRGSTQLPLTEPQDTLTTRPDESFTEHKKSSTERPEQEIADMTTLTEGTQAPVLLETEERDTEKPLDSVYESESETEKKPEEAITDIPEISTGQFTNTVQEMTTKSIQEQIEIKDQESTTDSLGSPETSSESGIKVTEPEFELGGISTEQPQISETQTSEQKEITTESSLSLESSTKVALPTGSEAFEKDTETSETPIIKEVQTEPPVPVVTGIQEPFTNVHEETEISTNIPDIYTEPEIKTNAPETSDTEIERITTESPEEKVTVPEEIATIGFVTKEEQTTQAPQVTTQLQQMGPAENEEATSEKDTEIELSSTSVPPGTEEYLTSAPQVTDKEIGTESSIPHVTSLPQTDSTSAPISEHVELQTDNPELPIGTPDLSGLDEKLLPTETGTPDSHTTESHEMATNIPEVYVTEQAEGSTKVPEQKDEEQHPELPISTETPTSVVTDHEKVTISLVSEKDIEIITPGKIPEEESTVTDKHEIQTDSPLPIVTESNIPYITEDQQSSTLKPSTETEETSEIDQKGTDTEKPTHLEPEVPQIQIEQEVSTETPIALSTVKETESKVTEEVPGTKETQPICENEDDCKNIKTPEIPLPPCEGESCKEIKIDCTLGECIEESGLPQTSQEDCAEEGGCKKTETEVSEECLGDKCRRKDIIGLQDKPQVIETDTDTEIPIQPEQGEEVHTVSPAHIPVDQQEIGTKLPVETATDLPVFVETEVPASIPVTTTYDKSTESPKSTMAPQLIDESGTKVPEILSTDQKETKPEEDLITVTQEIFTKVQEDLTESPESLVTKLKEETTETPDIFVTKHEESITTESSEKQVTDLGQTEIKIPDTAETEQQQLATDSPIPLVTKSELETRAPEFSEPQDSSIKAGEPTVVTKIPESVSEIGEEHTTVSDIQEPEIVPQTVVTEQLEASTTEQSVIDKTETEKQTEVPVSLITEPEDISTIQPKLPRPSTKQPEPEEFSTKQPEVREPSTEQPELEEISTNKPELFTPTTEQSELEEISTKQSELPEPTTKQPELEEISTKQTELQEPITKEPVFEDISTKQPELSVPTVKQTDDEETITILPEKTEPTSELPGPIEISTKQPESLTEQPEIVEYSTKYPEPVDISTKQPESLVTEQQSPEKETSDSSESAPYEEPAGTKLPLEPSSETSVTSQSGVTLSPPDPEITTESKKEASETTPYLVELEEHTHPQIENEIVTVIPSKQPTTEQSVSVPESEQITTELSGSDQTESPSHITEEPSDVKESITTPVVKPSEPEVYPTTSSVLEEAPEKTTELSISTDQTATDITKIVPAKPADRFGAESQEDLGLTTAAPKLEEEQLTTLPISSETEKPDKDIAITTEKDIASITSKPIEADIPFETTAAEEELIPAVTKVTTAKIEEEITTQSPILSEKFTKPEESETVSEVVSPTPASEIPKPGSGELQPTDEVPSPEDESHFPPSGGYGQEPDYMEEDQAFGPGTCRYGGKVYVSAQQIPRDDPCDFCFCFRSDIICLQQSCPPPIHGCHEEPIQGFCCPRYECPVSMATTLNVTTTTTTTTTTLPPHFLPHAYKGAAQRRGCQIKGHTYKVGDVVRASSGPCLHCTCGGDGQMKCDPKVCTPEPMLRQMIAAAVSAKRRR